MKMILYTLIPIILLAAACSEYRRQQRIPVCANLYEAVRQELAYDSLAKVYVVKRGTMPENFIEAMHSHPACVNCMRQRDVRGLFGQPSEAAPTYFAYYLNVFCHGPKGKSEDNCRFLQIVFDEEGFVNGTGLIHNAYKD